MSKPIVAVCSVELEMKPLLARLRIRRDRPGGRGGIVRAALAEREVIAVIAGMGKTNAARALTAVLEKDEVAGIVGFGVAGAYLGVDLAPGDIAVATAEHYGDEGVATPAGWISCEGIGIPLLSGNAGDYFNRFPVDEASIPPILAALHDQGIAAASGDFVTVSCCSGTGARGAELARRFGAICETMEGAAYAHVAATYEVPFLEIRGISNLVEDRDLSRWRLDDAAEAAAAAVAATIAVWNPEARTTTRANR